MRSFLRGESFASTLLLLAMALTIAIYWPALHGGYFFDDGVSLLNNTDVHVTSVKAREWIRAAFAQASFNALARPLSSLTFALNYYLTGLDPFWPKSTNLGIHLLNGVLLFWLLRELLFFAESAGRFSQRPPAEWAVAVIAGIWLILPINFTSVAYISQRVQELSTTFVFAGLVWYLRSRGKELTNRKLWFPPWLAIVVSTAVGLTAKEDAALLPLYAACAEYAITSFRREGKLDKRVIATFVATLLVPFVAGVLWTTTWAFRNVEAFRPFTSTERLLTEPRVLIDYVRWTLLPNLDQMTFFHDDIAISHGLFDPPTTFLAILALVAMFAAGVLARRSRPLFCLGILWFFAGHSMTATIVPLELAFEHRNYFPSVGLLLALGSLLTLESKPKMQYIALAIPAACFCLYGWTTYLRAEEWSSPLRLAYSEALKRPDSPRAQYELARTLIVAAGDDQDSPLLQRATDVLERSLQKPGGGITALQALIFINGRAHDEIKPEWWRAIIARLGETAPSRSDIEALIFLFHCQLNGDCPREIEALAEAFQVALTRSGGNLNLQAAYADFAYLELGDAELAERMLRETVEAAPKVAAYRSDLIVLLIAVRKFDDAGQQLQILERQSLAGEYDELIASLRKKLQDAQSVGPDAAGVPAKPGAG